MIEFEADDELVDDAPPYVHQFIRQPDPEDMESGPYNAMMLGKRRRTVIHWVIFGAHVIPFALFILAYPGLADSNPGVFATNLVWLLLPIWGVLIIGHLMLVALIDLRETLIFARRDRQRRDIDR